MEKFMSCQKLLRQILKLPNPFLKEACHYRISSVDFCVPYMIKLICEDNKIKCTSCKKHATTEGRGS